MHRRPTPARRGFAAAPTGLRHRCLQRRHQADEDSGHHLRSAAPWAVSSVADGEAAPDETGQFRLIDEGDCGVLHRDAAAPVRVEYGLIAADPERARTLAGRTFPGWNPLIRMSRPV
ncbi:hypothetical protein [Streptomyces virginiae]|uniref:hypothetical protein n=1 Tax=Streptomyces virginiae TaxID=1961 RepID=UPI00386DC61E